MQVQTPQRVYTPEEYLALEETAEYKSEYHDGEIIPMTGGTTNHNKIALNFCRKFPLTIQEQNYEIFLSDVRLWIPRYRRYVYPDVMVIQGQPIYEGSGKTTVTNPLLIIEVLSPSTKNYDKGDKFEFYRSIRNFQEYILIDPSKFQIEQYTRTSPTQWLFTEYQNEDSIVNFSSVSFNLCLKELYERVDFNDSEEE